ncbi:hypothetical protein L228DRAFT_260421 [Xylona heveae TC161]|uniref:Zn(2)-C6 fungal-type domain-containing protein n=1 Tax=Xylona heveae (strain CBS 132557 / TC161) TaxID=1328760 RepID=A0A165HK13_XYLHT|nr:hypothetical protein L228DRAFT_260421 [Xylona heveae TC161]KZF23630.1 hypothetical protein L228DRAFT_260421 [Xylona heveae TC161]
MSQYFPPLRPAASSAVATDESSEKDSEKPSKRPRRHHSVAPACLFCRKKKAKCDRTRPKCSNCLEKGVDCVYDAGENENRYQMLRRKNKELEAHLNVYRHLFDALRASSVAGHPELSRILTTAELHQSTALASRSQVLDGDAGDVVEDISGANDEDDFDKESPSLLHRHQSGASENDSPGSPKMTDGKYQINHFEPVRTNPCSNEAYEAPERVQDGTTFASPMSSIFSMLQRSQKLSSEPESGIFYQTASAKIRDRDISTSRKSSIAIPSSAISPSSISDTTACPEIVNRLATGIDDPALPSRRKISEHSVSWPTSHSPSRHLPGERRSYEESLTSTVFLRFRDAALQMMADGVPAPVILGPPEFINFDLFFRERTSQDNHTVSSFACEVCKTLPGQEIFVLLAGAMFLGYLMRASSPLPKPLNEWKINARNLQWTLLPTAENYARVPDIVKPLISEAIDTVGAVANILSSPTFYQAIAHKYHKWLIPDGHSSGSRTVRWPFSLGEAITRDNQSGCTRLTLAFEQHVLNPKNWG